MQSDTRVRGETKKEKWVCPSSICSRTDINANGRQRRLKQSFIYDLYGGCSRRSDHLPAHMWLSKEIR